MNEPRQLSTLEKALQVNLDDRRYGTFAEIGAGQEVVRWFFQAGGAAGTISKSISAYDMQVSDAIYGDCDRYVSRARLESMLRHEQQLNRQRLQDKRCDNTTFFTFADTVSARNYHGTNDCHAWLGVEFQHEAGADNSRIVLHVRLLDASNAEQQQAIGIVGVNLIYGTFFLADDPRAMLKSLCDDLCRDRIEIDLVDVSGPAFDGIDNRVLSLRLVELGLTGAAMFASNGEVLQSAEALRKRPLLVQRGRFRPLTHVNMDMLASARERFVSMLGEDGDSLLPIMEMSMHDLAIDDEVCLADFLARAEVVSTTGSAVLISDYREYYRLADYLLSQTTRPIALALGLESFRALFAEGYYKDLSGGVLESFGRLFKQQMTLLVYPVKDARTGGLRTLDQLELGTAYRHLFRFLRERGSVLPLDNVTEGYLDIHSPDVLNMIVEGNERWIDCVPEAVAERIVAQRLFGYGT
ncbi:MAG: TonB-dependent receptor [Pseudomonadota bacterium]